MSPRHTIDDGSAASTDTTRSSSKTRSSSSRASSSVATISPSGLAAPTGFTMEEIVKATGNFAASNVIGEGAFGTVYKGKLRDGSLVAIKRAKQVSFHENHEKTWLEFISSAPKIGVLRGEKQGESVKAVYKRL